VGGENLGGSGKPQIFTKKDFFLQGEAVRGKEIRRDCTKRPSRVFIWFNR